VSLPESETAPSTTAGATEAWLVSRGLLGGAMFGEQSRRDMITPPSGVEVTKPGRRRTRLVRY
jgi:hypothetical protein